MARELFEIRVANGQGHQYDFLTVGSMAVLGANAPKSRNELGLIEVKCSIGARDDLDRPTTTTLENKRNFMEYLESLDCK